MDKTLYVSLEKRMNLKEYADYIAEPIATGEADIETLVEAMTGLTAALAIEHDEPTVALRQMTDMIHEAFRLLSMREI